MVLPFTHSHQTIRKIMSAPWKQNGIGKWLTLLILVLLAIKITFSPISMASSSDAPRVQSSHSQKKKHTLRGDLEAHPVNLTQCVTLRIRGEAGDDHARLFPYPNRYAPTAPSSNILLWNTSSTLPSWGLVFVEDPDEFVSLGSSSQFHLFHFLEFFVMAFAAAVPEEQSSSTSSTTTTRTTTLDSLQWLSVPLFFSPKETCGVGKELNCRILDLFRPHLPVHGLEANDATTRQSHPAYAQPSLRQKREQKRRKFERYPPLPTLAQRTATYHTMMDQVDAVLLVHRPSCKRKQRINLRKMITNVVGHFPADAWYQQVQRGLAEQQEASAASYKLLERVNPQQLQVCYVDRKNKRPLPPFFHDWLVENMNTNPRIQFWHLHMEELGPQEQVLQASLCQVLMGGHGNGLSHVLWMKPESFVMEFFWNFGFHYDYGSMAQLMRHHYRAWVNGYLAPGSQNIARLASNRETFWAVANETLQINPQRSQREHMKLEDFDPPAIHLCQHQVLDFVQQALDQFGIL